MITEGIPQDQNGFLNRVQSVKEAQDAPVHRPVVCPQF